jgi:ribosomal protein L37E
MPHEVFAVEGEQFPACRRCGPRAYFSLLQQATHIGHDQDFSQAATEKNRRARAAKARKDD